MLDDQLRRSEEYHMLFNTEELLLRNGLKSDAKHQSVFYDKTVTNLDTTDSPHVDKSLILGRVGRSTIPSTTPFLVTPTPRYRSFHCCLVTNCKALLLLGN